MTEKRRNARYVYKEVTDEMSSIKRLAATFPAHGAIFCEDEFKQALSQASQEMTLERARNDISRLEADGYIPLETVVDEERIPHRTFEGIYNNTLQAIDRHLVDFEFDETDPAVSRLISLCLRLGVLSKEIELRQAHYKAVRRVRRNDQAFRNDTSGRTAYNASRKARAKQWHAVSQDVILKYGAKDFWSLSRTRQAAIVVLELRRSGFDLKKETVANFIRKIGK